MFSNGKRRSRQKVTYVQLCHLTCIYIIELKQHCELDLADRKLLLCITYSLLSLISSLHGNIAALTFMSSSTPSCMGRASHRSQEEHGSNESNYRVIIMTNWFICLCVHPPESFFLQTYRLTVQLVFIVALSVCFSSYFKLFANRHFFITLLKNGMTTHLHVDRK